MASYQHLPYTPQQNNKKCSLCGHPALGGWEGQTDIYVCGNCAMEQLPALIADSTRIGTTADAYRAFDRITQRFWKALALKLLRDNERRLGGGQ